MATLKKVSYQLFSRPDDERFEDFDSFYQHCYQRKEESETHWKAPSDVIPMKSNRELGLKLTGDRLYSLNDWSFGQMRSADSSMHAEPAIATFKALVDDFRDKYAVDARRIRLSREEKHELIKAQNNLCPICNSSVYIHDELAVDHLEPIATGGKDVYENLRVTHYFCNLRRGVGVRNG